MKKGLIIIFLSIIGLTNLSAQELTLFDSEGEAIAYIDYSEDETIFLWNGNPVAFLENDGGDIYVFGFNGNFLGWYVNGIIYDKSGNPVGAKKGAVNMRLQRESRKSRQYRIPRKPRTPRTPRTPRWSRSWSSISLTNFLYSGKN